MNRHTLSTGMITLAIAFSWLSTSLAQPSTTASPHHSEQEIQFSSANGSVQYGGTLTLPAGEGRFPAAVFLSVAGPNDRDQSVGDKRGFQDLARHLAAQRIASIRFDDRGVGDSTGDYFAASWEDFARDASMAYDLLAEQAAIDAQRIGFIGMSQGGALSAMASEMRPDTAFIVLLSAPGLTGEAALRGQLETTLTMSGITGAVADQYRDLFNQFMGIVDGIDSPLGSRREKLLTFLDGPGAALMPSYGFVPQDKEGIADMLLSPWYNSNVSFDPEPTYSVVTVPVLALGGELDPVAPPEQHLSAIQGFLEGAPTDDVTTITLERGNHLLQEATTGLPAEYATLNHAISPEALTIITSWIKTVLD